MSDPTGQPRESILAQLRYPLVFFGLALLVVEAAFGVGLATNSTSTALTIVLSSWMGVLFLAAILVVAFLVYKVPTHIMLESQRQLRAEVEALTDLRSRVSMALRMLESVTADSLADPESFGSQISSVVTILNATPKQPSDRTGRFV